MKQSIIHIALVVKDYDEAIEFYTKKLHFTLIEDSYQPEQDKRWVVVAPPDSSGTTVLLAKASKPEQHNFIGNQSGGRVFLFLNTDDFWRDYHDMIAKGIKFSREPKQADYGMVAVFEDLYGNLWDLLQLNPDHPLVNTSRETKLNPITLNNKQIYPSKVVCIGRNYVDHINELNNETPTKPVIFIKPNSAICAAIKFDKNDSIQYESEISFVVEAGKLIAVGFGLDLTKREIQSKLKAKGLPWERAKAFDRSAVFSEFISFDGDIADVRLELFINDKLIQFGGIDLMLYKPEEILKDISSFCTLEDGDIIMTGTPKGVGEINYGDRFVGKIFQNDKFLLSKAWTVK